MKTLAKFLLPLFAFAAVACVEDNIDTQPEKELSIEIDAFETYNVQATSVQPILFNISSNTPWKIASDQEWCVPSPAMSSASSLVAEISVAIADNETKEPRTAVITVTADGIEKPTVITVNQDVVGVLNVRPADGLIPVSGGSVQFGVTSNKAWTATSDAMWLTLDKTSGEGAQEEVIITATAAPNDVEFRTAKVTVEAEGQNPYSFTLSQDGAQFEVSVTEIKAAWNEGHVTVDVNANTEWEVSKDDISADWYSFEATEFGGGISTLKVLLNDYATSAEVARKTSFTIKAKANPNLRKQVVLRQAYNPTTTYEFVLSATDKEWPSDETTWSRRYNNGVDGYPNNKVEIVTEGGKKIMDCVWKGQVQKRIVAAGTYTFNVLSTSDLGMPFAMGNLNEAPDYSNQEIDLYINISKKTYQTVYKTGPWNAAKIGLNETLPVTVGTGAMNYGIKFSEAEGGYVKITWYLNGEEIKSFVANGSDDAGSAPLMYGKEINFYMGNNGNPTQYYGRTKFESWSYTLPDGEINWGE